MSIVASEIVWRTSVEMSDAGTNGGKMTATAIPTGVKNNIWPDVPQSERTAGSIKYRKVHVHIANDADLELVQARVFVETYTPGDDNVILFAGTHTDTQSGIGSPRYYGGGQLNADVSAAATSIDVAVDVATASEASTLNMFQNGDLIRISDKTDVDDVGGNEEYATISGAPSYAGDIATITLTAGLANGYTGTATRVSSVYEAGDISGSVASFSVTSGLSGTYDDTTYPVAVDSIGGVEANWTLEFTSATNFTVKKDAVSVGAGTVSGDVQPTNSDFSKPYFVMQFEGFGGTFQSGDTITFTTHPASIPLWYRRKVPAGAASLSGNKIIVAVDGQSA